MGFVSDFVGDITGANDAADAAKDASKIQSDAAKMGIEEQRRQFDKLVELMSPYVNAGVGALGGQQDLLGLSGAGAQRKAIEALTASPQFQSLIQQGENAMLQNASATGGLRGGNIQAAMSQFRPQMLSQLIDQQFGRLGGLTQIGQAAASGQAAAGQASGNNIAALLQQMGAARAGGELAAGGARRQGFSDLLGIGGLIGGFF